ncbi:hypothetical protein GCM10011348_39720 [Marinobacterium nitratireducens]|uniref:DUF502 domain-containing protein n=1 Tax=Marinobacterium nitratireducens TaxID=518897 RepID=A0A918DXV8_9GAMM|nr:DUF502 domain-containing protein [Marinobacterium nitratireducens]GGO87166.1 hypothetical protein GCM10011348_39720 [Marinobacterium nitratireducens]
MLKFLSRNILTGLLTLLPVMLTLYLFYWLLMSIELALGGLIRFLLPDALYMPGMGLVAALLMTLAVGILMHAYVVQKLFAAAEDLLYRMPLIKSVYRAIRDFFDYFSPDAHKEFEQVVAVTFGDMQLIGFVTQAVTEKLPASFRDEDCVLVYLPLSYMIGGYAVLIPRSRIRPVEMSMEEAMRFTLTAGVAGATTAGRTAGAARRRGSVQPG